jgi:hypothetical protein
MLFFSAQLSTSMFRRCCAARLPTTLLEISTPLMLDELPLEVTGDQCCCLPALTPKYWCYAHAEGKFPLDEFWIMPRGSTLVEVCRCVLPATRLRSTTMLVAFTTQYG